MMVLIGYVLVFIGGWGLQPYGWKVWVLMIVAVMGGVFITAGTS